MAAQGQPTVQEEAMSRKRIILILAAIAALIGLIAIEATPPETCSKWPGNPVPAIGAALPEGC